MGHKQFMPKMLFRFFLLFSFFSFFLISCGEKIIYKDRPVEFEKKDTKNQWGKELFLQPGIFTEQLFKKLNKGDELHIIQGFQGGTWIHLSVRISGVPSVGRVEILLTDTETKEKVASVGYDLKLVRSAEGFLEAYDIPIPIKAEGAALTALYGRSVLLEASFTAGKKKVSAKLTLKLAKG